MPVTGEDVKGLLRASKGGLKLVQEGIQADKLLVVQSEEKVESEPVRHPAHCPQKLGRNIHPRADIYEDEVSVSGRFLLQQGCCSLSEPEKCVEA